MDRLHSKDFPVHERQNRRTTIEVYRPPSRTNQKSDLICTKTNIETSSSPFSQAFISKDEDANTEHNQDKPRFDRQQSPTPQFTFATVSDNAIKSPVSTFTTPLFTELTKPTHRRSLLAHFVKALSPLMACTGGSINPFQHHVLPMSAVSPAVLYAILALSSAHLEYRGTRNRESSLEFHLYAIAEVQKSVNQKIITEETIAAIVVLIYYEMVSIFLIK